MSSLGEEFTEKESTSRLIRSLPESFSGTDLVPSFFHNLQEAEPVIRAEVDGKIIHITPSRTI